MQSTPAIVGLLLLLTAGLAQAEKADFLLASSGVALSGYWPVSPSNSRPYSGGAYGSQLDASVVGTSMDVTCYSKGATNITVTVDGVTYTPTFFKVNEWTSLAIDLGAEGTHALTIKQSFEGSDFYLDTGTGPQSQPTFIVKGAAPSIGAPTANFGPQYQLSDPVGVTPFIQPEGGLVQQSAGGYPSLYFGAGEFPDEGLYFTASATGTIQAWMYGGGGLLSLFVDGVEVGTVAQPQVANYGWVTLFQGDGAPHRYGVASANPHYGFYMWSLMTVGGSLSPVVTIPRPHLITYGDSIVQGLRGTGNDSSQAFSQQLGASLGWAVFNRGVSGTTVHEFPSGDVTYTDDAGEARTTDVTSNAAGADAVVILYGTNDMAQEGGPETTAAFQTSYQAMLTKIAAGVPSTCPIICLGILPRTNFTPSAIAVWNSAIEAAVSATGAPNVQYADTSNWGLLQDNGPDAKYTDPAAHTFDGLHPNDVGYGVLLSHLTPLLVAPGPPTITSALSGTIQIGEAAEYQISGSNAPATFSASGLPAGMTLDAAGGKIVGTPTAGGTFPIALAAANGAGTGSATLTLQVAVPVVTIVATVPEITATGGELGEFTLSIPDARTTELLINYDVKGDAVPGVDYLALSGVAKFKAGDTSKVIKITPLGNVADAGTVKVKLTLEPGTNYAVGTTTPAEVKIMPGP